MVKNRTQKRFTVPTLENSNRYIICLDRWEKEGNVNLWLLQKAQYFISCGNDAPTLNAVKVGTIPKSTKHPHNLFYLRGQ
jgi:hypothetical protein